MSLVIQGLRSTKLSVRKNQKSVFHYFKTTDENNSIEQTIKTTYTKTANNEYQIKQNNSCMIELNYFIIHTKVTEKNL